MKQQEGSWTKIGTVATVIGTIIAVAMLFQSGSGDKQSNVIFGSNNSVNQTIQPGMSKEEICENGEKVYLSTIKDIQEKSKHALLAKDKVLFAKDIEKAKRELQKYQKTCYKK